MTDYRTNTEQAKVICRHCGEQTFVDALPAPIGVRTDRQTIRRLFDALKRHTFRRACNIAAVPISTAYSIFTAIERAARAD